MYHKLKKVQRRARRTLRPLRIKIFLQLYTNFSIVGYKRAAKAIMGIKPIEWIGSSKEDLIKLADEKLRKILVEHY